MNLLKKLQRHPVISGVAAVIAGVGIFAGAMHAWGPSRTTFTMASPAPYVTFNAITDNPRHGDERNFVQIRNYTDNGQFGENVDLVAGKEYEVYVFYHNNASPDLNDADSNYKGIALDARMRVQMPSTVKAGENARVTGFVSASNATPGEVWDEAYGKNTTNGGMALRYVPNSAKITSNGSVNGKAINLDSLAGNGALLGYDALDGKLPGCSQYSGYVTYRFVADQPNFEVKKDVAAETASDYTDSTTVAPGTKVDYRIVYKNTGTVTQENVSIKDNLPNGVTYVPGSTMYASSKTGGKWAPTNSDAVVKDGINFGAFAPGAELYVKFSARVANSESFAVCGLSIITNTAQAITSNGVKSDTAVVKVNKPCTPTPVDKDVEVCEIASRTVKTIKESELKANPHLYADKDSDKCKPEQVSDYSIIKEVSQDKQPRAYSSSTTAKPGDTVHYRVKVKNTGNTELTDLVVKDVLPANMTYVQDSTYISYDKSFSATVMTNDIATTQGVKISRLIAGETATITYIAVVPKADKLVCGTNTLKNVATVITKLGDKSSNAVVTVTKECDTTPPVVKDEDVTVCDIEAGKIVTIKESVYNANKDKYADKDSEKCKPVTVCEISSKTVITISKEQYNAHKDLYTDQNSEVCKPAEQPETPEVPKTDKPVVELPKTGLDLSAMSLVGAGALTYAGYAYIASRRG